MFQYLNLRCIVGEVIYHCVLINGIPDGKYIIYNAMKKKRTR